MTVKRFLITGLGGLVGLWLAAACHPAQDRAAGSPPDSGGGPPTGGSDSGSPMVGDDAGPSGGSDAGSSGGSDAGSSGGSDARPPVTAISDPAPRIAFPQVGRAEGITRSNEPASAGRFDPTFAAAYGSW